MQRVGAFGLCIVVLTGCVETSSTAPQTTPPQAAAKPTNSAAPGAGTLSAEGFQLSGGRVISQSGQNTAIVEVTRPRNFPSNSSSVRLAAQEWCGRPAQVSPLNSRSSRMTSRRSYVVRCL